MKFPYDFNNFICIKIPFGHAIAAITQHSQRFEICMETQVGFVLQKKIHWIHGIRNCMKFNGIFCSEFVKESSLWIQNSRANRGCKQLLCFQVSNIISRNTMIQTRLPQSFRNLSGFLKADYIKTNICLLNYFPYYSWNVLNYLALKCYFYGYFSTMKFSAGLPCRKQAKGYRTAIQTMGSVLVENENTVYYWCKQIDYIRGWSMALWLLSTKSSTTPDQILRTHRRLQSSRTIFIQYFSCLQICFFNTSQSFRRKNKLLTKQRRFTWSSSRKY